MNESPAAEPSAKHRAEEYRDRTRGCLLAVACADALGSAFHRQQPAAPGQETASPPAPPRAEEPLRPTGCTTTVLVMSRHLTQSRDSARPRIDDHPLAAELVYAWLEDGDRDYPPDLVHDLTLLAGGDSLLGTAPGRQNAPAPGNSAVLRATPVGLLPDPLNRVAEHARRCAELTHSRPAVLDAAALHATAVAYGHRFTADQPFDAAHLLDTIAPFATSPELRAQLTRLNAVLRKSLTPRDTAQRLDTGNAAVPPIATALAAFSHAPDDPSAVLRFALDCGGSTPDIAAMAAAMAGARCGAAALPTAWITRLQNRAAITAAADALAGASA